MKRNRILAIALLMVLLFGCRLAGTPLQTPDIVIQPVPSQTEFLPTDPPPDPTDEAPVAPAIDTTPMLTLDRNYFCNHGPGSNYLDVVDFPAGTTLPILGTNGAGWWLVRIDDRRTSHTSCWIGGGTPSGDISGLPFPDPGAFVPVHDGTNWLNIIYLDCEHLERYDWVFGGSSSGEYAATEPILGIAIPTVKYEEWMPVCPAFAP